MLIRSVTNVNAKKCGKIREYSLNTLKTFPQYCFRPIYCSFKSQSSYSYAAKAATKRKKEKYKNNESVILLDNKNQIVPSIEYCEAWNKKKRIEQIKKEEKQKKKQEQIQARFDALPKVIVKNYDNDYSGTIFESFEILKCVNEKHESTNIPCYMYKNGFCNTMYIYKQYLCKCYLCGKEKTVTHDRFNIFLENYIGYHGYLYCDCHKISSFQWIINKLLIDNKISYRVEVSFSDLYGISGNKLLRFDFAVYNKDGSIKCLIECQGEQHYKPIDEFGGKKQFHIQQKNDEAKRNYTKNHNIKLVEISYKDKNIKVVQNILQKEGIL